MSSKSTSQSGVDPGEGLGDFNQRILKSSLTSEVAAWWMDQAGEVHGGGKRISWKSISNGSVGESCYGST